MVTRMTHSRLGNVLPKPFAALDREMNQFFGDLFARSGERPAPTWPAPASLWEDKDHYFIEVEMPGVKLENIELTVEKGVLHVVAERKAPEEERTYWHQERAYGRIERAVTLPELADADSIDAELKEGVLTISIAKRPEAQPKRINVRS